MGDQDQMALPVIVQSQPKNDLTEAVPAHFQVESSPPSSSATTLPQSSLAAGLKENGVPCASTKCIPAKGSILGQLLSCLPIRRKSDLDPESPMVCVI